MLVADPLAHLPHLVEGGVVGPVEPGPFAAALGSQLGQGLLAAGRVAPVDEHGGARPGELAGERAPESVRGAGDQDRAQYSTEGNQAPWGSR